MVAATAFLAALWAAALLGAAHARTFVEVPADEEVCFIETLRAGERLRGSYQVVSGGYLDIDVQVRHLRKQKNLVEQWRQEDGKFEILTEEDGDHRICFGNRLATNAVKKVQFAIHAGNVDELLEHEVEGLADIHHVDRLNDMVLRLGRRVSDLKEQEEYLRRRSERHHRTAESNNSRVLMSSIAEAVVLVGVNAWQIYYLRRFFEVKRII